MADHALAVPQPRVCCTVMGSGSSTGIHHVDMDVSRPRAGGVRRISAWYPHQGANKHRHLSQPGFPPHLHAKKTYRIVHWTEMAAGGHFAALEQPSLLLADMQRFFADQASTKGNRRRHAAASMTGLVGMAAIGLWALARGKPRASGHPPYAASAVRRRGRNRHRCVELVLGQVRTMLIEAAGLGPPATC